MSLQGVCNGTGPDDDSRNIPRGSRWELRPFHHASHYLGHRSSCHLERPVRNCSVAACGVLALLLAAPVLAHAQQESSERVFITGAVTESTDDAEARTNFPTFSTVPGPTWLVDAGIFPWRHIGMQVEWSTANDVRSGANNPGGAFFGQVDREQSTWIMIVGRFLLPRNVSLEVVGGPGCTRRNDTVSVTNIPAPTTIVTDDTRPSVAGGANVSLPLVRHVTLIPLARVSVTARTNHPGNPIAVLWTAGVGLRVAF